jgi:hypothetical protein
MSEKKYTKKEVLELLKKQRELCYINAKTTTHEYVNPFSDSDGDKTTVVSKDSIINADIPKL